ncbi:MAG: globin domain-containing protein [Polyangiaceae bacterium]
MFTDEEKKAILSSWRLVVPIADTAADSFYKRLFQLRPDYRRLFPEDMSGQKRKLVKMLAFIVKSLDWVDEQWKDEVDPTQDLMLVVLAMGRRHSVLYNIPDESYATVGEALVWTLDYGLGEAFTPTVRNAWIQLYTLVAGTMRMGGATVEPESDMMSADDAEHQGSEALMSQQAEMGIDEARLGLAEELS